MQEKTDREGFWLALENKRRVALGEEPIASLDELAEEEPSIASNDGSAQATPLYDVEMVDPASAISVLQTDDAHEIPEEEEEDKTPDPYLIESGHILLDLISLEERTAAGLKQSRDT